MSVTTLLSLDGIPVFIIYLSDPILVQGQGQVINDTLIKQLQVQSAAFEFITDSQQLNHVLRCISMG